MVHCEVKETKVWRIATDCSGIEAPIEALKRMHVPYEHVWSSEICKKASHWIRHHHSPSTLYSDISQRDASSLPHVDLYVAGFPCQPSSSLSHHHSFSMEDPRAEVGIHCVKAILSSSPSAFVLENVTRLTSRGKKLFDCIVALLMEDGRYVVDWKGLNAKDYGVPQSRGRIYIVGLKKEEQVSPFLWPPPIPLTLSAMDGVREKERWEGEWQTPSKFYMERVKEWEISKEEKGVFDIGVEGMARVGKKRRRCPVKGDVSPCLIRTQKPGMFVNHQGRLLTGEECLWFQGIPSLPLPPGMKDKSLREMAGNSMCVDVLTNIFFSIFKSLGREEGVTVPPPLPPIE